MKNKDMEKNSEIKTVVPALRFPEFITGKHWYISKVKDIYQITRGLVLAVSLVKEIKDDIYIYPVYSSQTKNGGLVGYYKDYLYENAITWTTDGANAGDVNYRSGKFYCTNVCGVLLNQKGFSNKCMAEIINSVTRNYVSYVGNPKLMNGVMGDIIISVPPTIEEQQKIADCLSSLDELIEATTQKVKALKEHKKGLMQRLFPAEGKNVPDLRFPEFQGMKGWEKKQVKDFGGVITGNTPSKKEEKYWNGDFVWVTAQDFKGKYINDSILKLTKLGKDRARVIPKDSVLVTCIASIGLNAINKVECSTNQQINAICCNQEYNYEYVYYLVTYNTKNLKQLAGQTAVPIITKKSFEEFEVYAIENYDEQQKIADCLSSLDELIEATSRKLEILKEHKKGLMQQLFPQIQIK